ncbi:MAG TPA: arabinogalactan endo-1,4-beta-galactosidase [Steroidobacteraceae bacterium]|nr:arabinogalactan endo-1,4-beta-galactosidase [Steroidobacteraceae bacterium]
MKLRMLVCFALVSIAPGVNASSVPELPALQNLDFENDGTGVAAPLSWESAGTTDADFTEAGGRASAFRLSHFSAAAFDVETRQRFQAPTPGWYTFRTWVRRSTGENSSQVEVRCGSRTHRVDAPVAWPNQWLQVVVSFQAGRDPCDLVLHTRAAGGQWSNFDAITLEPGAPRLSILGADVSSLKKSEDFGGQYFDTLQAAPRPQRNRLPATALEILSNHGFNFVRLRVWVNPADGYHDQDELFEMAGRARLARQKVLVDLHYSDSWADPGKQFKPAAWSNYTFEELKRAVYDHTFGVCEGLRSRGLAPAMIQLGNELNSGMLWPDGHTWNPPNWDNLAQLLNAGAAAVRACSPKTQIMLHLANGGDNNLYRWWFDNITSRAVDFDVIGFSYYGYWHGSLGDLQANLNDISARYSKDVVVAETAYPFVLADDDGWGNIIGLPGQLVAGYPATREGQAANQRDVLSIVRAVPGGRGLGAFYWDATWTGVVGNGWDPTNPASGNAWENQALFDFDGRPVPAMDVFQP